MTLLHWLYHHLILGWTKSEAVDALLAAATVSLAGFTARVAGQTRTLASGTTGVMTHTSRLADETKSLADATREATAAEDARIGRQLDAQEAERKARDEQRRHNLMRGAREELTVAVEVLTAPAAGHAWAPVSHALVDQLITSDIKLKDEDSLTLVRTVAAFERYNALASMQNATQHVGSGIHVEELRRLSTAARAQAEQSVLAVAVYAGPPLGFERSAEL